MLTASCHQEADLSVQRLRQERAVTMEVTKSLRKVTEVRRSKSSRQDDGESEGSQEEEEEDWDLLNPLNILEFSCIVQNQKGNKTAGNELKTFSVSLLMFMEASDLTGSAGRSLNVKRKEK